MADQQPKDDDLLGKFLAGETDPAESARVRQWFASLLADPSEPRPDDFTKFERIRDTAGRTTRPSPDRPDPTSRSGLPVDPDAPWRAVQQQMRTTGSRPVAPADPTGKPLPLPHRERNSGWYQTAFRIAAVLPVVISFGWIMYRLNYMGQDHPEANMMTLVTRDHQLSKTLPDGTKILLNRHSTLRYPTTFADDRRDVTLTGEAFFDVMPDGSRPFRIQARSAVVQVLGASFRVRAYDANVSVAVRRGNVQFSRGKIAR